MGWQSPGRSLQSRNAAGLGYEAACGVVPEGGAARGGADNLLEFVGALGVYGDVNDLLADSMLLYAQFCEQQDLEEVGEVRRRGRADAVQAMKEVSDNYHVRPPLPLLAFPPEQRGACSLPWEEGGILK